MAENVGEAELHIGADATGIGDDVTDAISGPLEQAAEQASRQLGDALGKNLPKGADAGARSFGQKFGAGMRKVGQTATDALGASMRLGTAAVATGVGAILGTAIASGMSRLAAIDTAEARLRGLGKNAEQVESIMAQVNDAVMGTYFSTADMADAASLLLTSGVNEGDELAAALEGVKGVAAATGSELGEVTNIFQKMAAKGKVSGRELEQLTSMGINGAAALADQFGVTQEKALDMVSAGEVSFEDFTAAITKSTGNMAAEVAQSFEGMKTSLVGWLGLVGEQIDKPFFDAAKKIMPAIEGVMSEIPGVVEQYMEPVGATMDKFADRVAGALSGLDVGGALGGLFDFIGQAGDLLLPVFTGLLGALGPLIADIPVLGKAFQGITGPVGIMIGLFIEMFRNSEVLRDAFSNLFSTLGTVFQSLEPVLTALSDVIAVVAGSLGDALGTAINAVLPLIERLASIFGDVAGDLLSALVPLIEQVASAFTGALGSALDSLMPLLLQLVNALIPPLFALLDGLLPVIVQLVEAGLSIFVAVLEALLPALLQIVEAALPILIDLINQLMPVIELVLPLFAALIEAIMPLVDVLLDMLIPVIEALLPVVETVFNAVGDIISAVMTVIEGVIETVLGIIEGDWDRAWNGIKKVFSGVWDYIKALVKGAVDVVWSVIKAALNLIKALWDGIWNGIKTVLSGVWDAIKSLVSGAINAVSSTISGVLSSISSAWSNAWNGIKNFFSDLWNGLKTAASNGINNVFNVVKGIKSKITGFFGSAGSWLVNAGKSILQGLTNGIKAAISGPIDAVKGGIQKIRNLLPFSPAKEGPFSGRGYTTFSGKALMQDFASAIAGQERMLRNTTAKALAAAYEPFKDSSIGVSGSIASGRVAAPPVAVTVAGGGSGMSREEMDYLAERIADNLWPMARGTDMVMDLATMGRNRRRRGSDR